MSADGSLWVVKRLKNMPSFEYIDPGGEEFSPIHEHAQ